MSHRCQADLCFYLFTFLSPETRVHLLAMPFPSKPVHTENPIAQAPLLPSPGVSVFRPSLLKVVIAQETAVL